MYENLVLLITIHLENCYFKKRYFRWINGSEFDHMTTLNQVLSIYLSLWNRMQWMSRKKKTNWTENNNTRRVLMLRKKPMSQQTWNELNCIAPNWISTATLFARKHFLFFFILFQ